MFRYIWVSLEVCMTKTSKKAHEINVKRVFREIAMSNCTQITKKPILSMLYIASIVKLAEVHYIH